MEKDKKSLEANLLQRSFLFSGMSIFAALAIFYLFYFGFFYSAITVVNLMGGELNWIPILVSVISLSLGLYTIYLSFKNGHSLWMQWQRKLAIDAEEKRILRLVEDTSRLEDSSSQEDELYSSKNQHMP